MPQLLDKKRVFVVAAPLAAAAVAAQLAQRLEGGAERAEEGAPLPRRAADGGVDGGQGLLETLRDVGKQLVSALDLGRGQLRGARGVAADRVQMADERFHLALERVGHLAEPLRGGRRRDDHRDLREGDRQRGDGDHSQEYVAPDDHALSRRACWYASRPRSIAVLSVSRPWFRASRPLAAASAAFARASAALSPRYSRVSRPLAGAYSSATAAPLTAPRMNASRMLPAPALSSRDIRRLLEDAHLDVEVFLRLF